MENCQQVLENYFSQSISKQKLEAIQMKENRISIEQLRNLLFHEEIPSWKLKVASELTWIAST
jgi:hypothetical protein